MSDSTDRKHCEHVERVTLYALHSLPPDEAAHLDAHISLCAVCQEELDQLRPMIDYFVDWTCNGMRISDSVRERLARRISGEVGREILLPTTRTAAEPDWESVAPGISCKLLATDEERERVSMLVRLAPGVEYPPHTHGGVEELHLLDGELWINDRKLFPGDYNRAEPGTTDRRVWTETGCTCVLVTSTGDMLR